MPILRVALDVPVARLFEYRADDASSEDIGRRVVVPFAKKVAVGVIAGMVDAASVPAERLKPVLRVLRGEPGFTAADLKLIVFAADYYHYPLGAAIMAALPTSLRRLRTHRSQPTGGQLTLTEAGALGLQQLPVRASRQRRLLQALEQGPLDHQAFRALAPQATGMLKQFIARGWVETGPPADAGAQPAPEIRTAPPLTAEQAQATAEICAALGAFRPVLLLGITGSGKSEVYLHAIAAAVAAGRQALLLVPEIALTPQLEGLIRDRFARVPAVSLHSGLGAGERLANWRAAQSGRARIVLGTRLAVFTPLPELGLIIVDEEHDASFKQAEGFRYSARDLAVVRAQQCNLPVVLGSATPALESYFNAASGRYRLLALNHRIGAAPPRIACIDTRGARLEDGLSAPLLEAIAERTARGEQSLVFINRRGYAPVLICHACGWVSGCHRCSAQLVLHLKERRLRCHHCGYQGQVPMACPACGSQQLAPLGQGTQRVEAALAERFPQARIMRIDRDSVRQRQAWPEMRRRIRERDVDVLVGTQLLAKGHDFPHLNLVAVLNADSMLYSTDFRASERLFALLAQVAGRAGRGKEQGTVLIQTEFPHHPLYRSLQRQDYRAFADNLLVERRQAGFPPFVHQALLRAEAPQLATALEFLGEAAQRGRRLDPRVTVYDPVPAALSRRAGRERAQLLVQSESRARLQSFLRTWIGQLAETRLSRARWSLDVDPLEF